MDQFSEFKQELIRHLLKGIITCRVHVICVVIY